MLLVSNETLATYVVLKAITFVIVSFNLSRCLSKIWQNPSNRFFWLVTAQLFGSFCCVIFHTPNEILRLSTVPPEHYLAWLIIAKIHWTIFLTTYLLKILNSVSRMELVQVTLKYPDWVVKFLNGTAVLMYLAAMAVFHTFHKTVLTDKLDSYALTAYGIFGVTWDAIASLIMIKAVAKISRQVKIAIEATPAVATATTTATDAPGETGVVQSPSTKSFLRSSLFSKQTTMYNIILACLASNVFFGCVVSVCYLSQDKTVIMTQINYVMLYGGVDTPMLWYLFNIRHVLNVQCQSPAPPEGTVENV